MKRDNIFIEVADVFTGRWLCNRVGKFMVEEKIDVGQGCGGSELLVIQKAVGNSALFTKKILRRSLDTLSGTTARSISSTVGVLPFLSTSMQQHSEESSSDSENRSIFSLNSSLKWFSDRKKSYQKEQASLSKSFLVVQPPTNGLFKRLRIKNGLLQQL